MATERKTRIHRIKSWPNYFNAVLKGWKTFELRYNDRDYRVGDKLLLMEFDPQATMDPFSGRTIEVIVQHMATPEVGDHAILGLKDGWCIMSIKPVEVKP